MTPNTKPEGVTDPAVRYGLLCIRDQVQNWLDFDRAQRDKEGLETTDATHIYCPPTWPCHGQLKNWVKCFDAALNPKDAAP